MDLRRLQDYCGANPERIAMVLGDLLDVKQQEVLEALLFPPLNEKDQKRFLEDARKTICAAGIPEGHSLLKELDIAVEATAASVKPKK